LTSKIIIKILPLADNLLFTIKNEETNVVFTIFTTFLSDAP